jgi:hypothetical protein
VKISVVKRSNKIKVRFMDKKFGEWLLDFAKYIATVAVAYPFLSGLPKTWLYYTAVIVGVGILIAWGLYLTRPKEPQVSEREKEKEKDKDPSVKSAAIPAAPTDAAVSTGAAVDTSAPAPAVVAPAVIASVPADADAVAPSAADTALVAGTPPPDVLPSDESLPSVPESSIRSDE